MRNKANNLANAISRETFKKLFLLYIVGNFQSGVYGKLRLHKIVYMIERKIEIKPFEFSKYHYGQYSESLDEAQDQLLSMGYLIATPLRTEFPGRSGNLFELADKGMRTYYSLFIDKINPNLKKKIRDTIKRYGYLSEEDLLKVVYKLPEFAVAGFNSVIISEQLPDFLEIKGLSSDDIEELEISLNPRFINLLNRMDNAFEQYQFDPQKVKKVARLI